MSEHNHDHEHTHTHEHTHDHGHSHGHHHDPEKRQAVVHRITSNTASSMRWRKTMRKLLNA